MAMSSNSSLAEGNAVNNSNSDLSIAGRASKLLKDFSEFVEHNIADVFEKLGRVVAVYPIITIVLSMLACGLCAIGFLNYEAESRTIKLWVPQDSTAINHYDFVLDTFGFESRLVSMICKPDANRAGLTTQVVLDYWTAHHLLLNTSSHVKGEYKKWDDRYPGEYVYDNQTEPWDDVTTYNGRNVVGMCFRNGRYCAQATILDVVGYDYDTIAAMSDEDIVAAVNNESNWVDLNGRGFDYTRVLGGIKYTNNDEEVGQIESVQALRGEYILTAEAIDEDNTIVDPSRASWEAQLIKEIRLTPSKRKNREVFKKSRVLPSTEEGFSQEFGDAINGDIAIVTYGYILLICYAAFSMGKRDILHSMVALAFCAILCVGLALMASYGMASAFGIFFTPLHQSLPFLILGLGVDDGFIISGEYQRQCMLKDYEKVRSRRVNKSMNGAANKDDNDPEQEEIDLMAATMKHAGVSVLITSVTDFVAFSVGSSTLLPALSSFCLYAAFGVLIVFLLNITLFSACVVLNAKRVRNQYRDCCCCFKVEERHTMFLASDFLEYYSKFSGENNGYNNTHSGDVPSNEVELATQHAKSESAEKNETGNNGEGSGTNDSGETTPPTETDEVAAIVTSSANPSGNADNNNDNNHNNNGPLTEDDFLAVGLKERPPCCFVVHKLPERMAQNFFRRLAEVLTSDIRIKLGVVAVALAFLSVCIWGTTQLEQDFDVNWFLPDDSYLHRYNTWNDRYFDTGADNTFVQFFTRDSDDFDYFENEELFNSIINDLVKQVKYLYNDDDNIVDWHGDFRSASESASVELTRDNFFENLYHYIHAEEEYSDDDSGARLESFIKFKDEDNPSEGVLGAAQIALYRGSYIEDADEQVWAMHKTRRDTKKIIDDYNRDYDKSIKHRQLFPFSFSYVFWEQFALIFDEFYRNVLISFAVITVITLILIPDVQTALLVLVSVTISIVDVLGTMYFNGLTIDSITMSYTVIAIGLTVDYSAHIGEAFLQSKQTTRDACVVDALYSVGASVFSGAFSTFLAVLVLSGSATYILQVFFLQFFFVTILGSIHGLVVLPVLLSLLGPKPNNHAHNSKH